MISVSKSKITEKGQGLTEYVLILAFIAGVAMMIFGHGGLKTTVVSTFEKTVELIASINEDDSRSPEEKDEAKTKAIARALAEKFLKYGDPNAKGSVARLGSDNKIMMPSSYMGIIVFADGSVEVYVPNSWGQSNWISDWQNSTNAGLRAQYADCMQGVSDALGGIDLNDTSALAEKFGVSSAAYQNGYAIIYDPGTPNNIRAVSLETKSGESGVPTRTTVNENRFIYQTSGPIIWETPLSD